MDKWFGLQVGCASPDDAATVAANLTMHSAFTMKNPNRFRAVFGALKGNTAGFHVPTGAGYDLLADWLIQLDPVNPQTTARMITSFDAWKRYDADRQNKMRAALKRIADTPNLSRDTNEMVTRILG
jgi:aminopeptidase N